MNIVYVAYTSYGDDVIGVYTTQQKALKSIAKNCSCIVKHNHNDGTHCGYWNMTLDKDWGDE